MDGVHGTKEVWISKIITYVYLLSHRSATAGVELGHVRDRIDRVYCYFCGTRAEYCVLYDVLVILVNRITI